MNTNVCQEIKRRFEILNLCSKFHACELRSLIDLCVSMFAAEALPELSLASSDAPQKTGWDFLQDLDFGLQPELVGCSPPETSVTTAGNSSERLKEKNRKAQKKFRERRKARVCRALSARVVLNCRPTARNA